MAPILIFTVNIFFCKELIFFISSGQTFAGYNVRNLQFLDRSLIKKSRKKMTKKIDRSFCFCYLCLFVCVCVCLCPLYRSQFLLQEVDFWHGVNSSKCNFLFQEILRFDLLMAIFRLFGSFFAIYPLLILKESVDRTK